MSASARHRIMRIEDFLAWEARQDIRYEFDGFEPVAMAGGSRNHARVQRNLAVAFAARLRNGRCEFLGSDMKLLAANRARYPDGQIVCGGGDGDATFTTTPTVVFEVVSPGDEARDRVVKMAEYARIASVQTYVLLEQDRPAVTVARRGEAGWITSQLPPDGTLSLPELGIEVPVPELYEGVTPPTAA